MNTYSDLYMRSPHDSEKKKEQWQLDFIEFIVAHLQIYSDGSSLVQDKSRQAKLHHVHFWLGQTQIIYWQWQDQITAV